MDQFPDESTMERSKTGEEPIRGGSIGLNRILSMFVEAAKTDSKPRFKAVLISGFTIFRNVLESKEFSNMSDIEEGLVTDVNLFLDYFDTYLSHTWSPLLGNRYCPVVVYFPDYGRVPKEILREKTGKRGKLFDLFQIFLKKNAIPNGQVKVLEHCRCFWTPVGKATYPHKELSSVFKDIVHQKQSAFVTNDPICFISHITLDHHLSYRLGNLQLTESYTGKIVPPVDFRFALDKEGGRLPFQSTPHVIMGDKDFIKPWVTPKIKRAILDTAQSERWLSRSDEEVRSRIAKIADISVSELRKYDFR